MIEKSDNSIFDLTIDHEGGGYLVEIAKWSKLFAILGLIFGALIIIIGLIASLVGSAAFSTMFGGFGALIGLIYAALGAVYLYPSWKLLKFSGSMPVGLRNNDQVMVNDAFKNLKTCFRFMGILTLVIIGLYILMILVMSVSGSGMGRF